MIHEVRPVSSCYRKEFHAAGCNSLSGTFTNAVSGHGLGFHNKLPRQKVHTFKNVFTTKCHDYTLNDSHVARCQLVRIVGVGRFDSMNRAVAVTSNWHRLHTEFPVTGLKTHTITHGK
jgi:hypothetical protein